MLTKREKLRKEKEELILKVKEAIRVENYREAKQYIDRLIQIEREIWILQKCGK